MSNHTFVERSFFNDESMENWNIWDFGKLG